MPGLAAAGTSPGPDAGAPAFEPAARAGNRLYIGAIGVSSGDATSQTAGIVATARGLLEAHGLTLADVRKLTVALIDRAFHAAALQVLTESLGGKLPAPTVFVANGLSAPESLLQIDFEAEFPDEDAPQRDLFLSAAVGPATGGARGLSEVSAQARSAMERLRADLERQGATIDDVCKITVFLPERSFRVAGYPEIGRLLGEIHPVSTGLIVPGLADVDTLFQLDVAAVRSAPDGHVRARKYKTATARYGQEVQQLDCGFCMAVRAGRHVFLRGQTAMDLDHRLHGPGDAVAQAEQAMRSVATLLADVGCTARDVVKATLYVVDRAHLEPCAEVIARHVGGKGATFTAVVVKGLAAADLLMEVDITAYASD